MVSRTGNEKRQGLRRRSRRNLIIFSAALPVLLRVLGSPVWAQTTPTIDTEDAGLSGFDVSTEGFHPVVTLDLRNGDFSRGAYDDDDADLERLPIHLQFAFAQDLGRGASGKANLWIVGTSSNGFHAPRPDERASPRIWYESNNLVGLIAEPTDGLRAGLVYTIKTSPNGVSDSTHEASATFAYDRQSGLGFLRPQIVATWRPKGGAGLFTQVGVEPEFDLSEAAESPSISIPIRIGVGWSGFYERGSGNLVYGSLGSAYSHPFTIGDTRWQLRAELLAVLRDDTLRRFGGPEATRATVVPLATLALTLSY